MTTVEVSGVAPVTVQRSGVRQRAATALSLLVLTAVLASAVVGLVVDGVYGDPPSTASMLRGYDLVTLVVVVPLLALALAGVRRNSPAACLLWAGMLAAVLYTYAYYLFGTGFNDAFLLHAVVFSAALFALVLALSALDVAGLVGRAGRGRRVRWIAGLSAFLAVGLGGMWIADALRFALTGQLPAGSALVEEPAVVHLGFALDLAVLVPAYALAGVLLWRRTPWGYVLAALMLISGTVHQLGYLVALPFQVAAGVPDATAFDPLEPLIAAAFLAAATTLLAGVRRPGRTSVASEARR